MNLDTKIATLMLSSGKNQQKFEIQATEIKAGFSSVTGLSDP